MYLKEADRVYLHARGGVDAVVGGGLGIERLRLRLHNVRQRSLARLVQTKVGGDDRGKLQLHGFETAIDFAGDADVIAFDIHRAVESALRSEEHTSELQSLMRISYAVFCLKKTK